MAPAIDLRARIEARADELRAESARVAAAVVRRPSNVSLSAKLRALALCAAAAELERLLR